MASAPIISLRPAGIRARAASGDRRSEGWARKSPSSKSAGNWWTPLFGWSPEPDYIDGSGGAEAPVKADRERAATREGGGTGRFVAFTEEKARQLRMKTVETATFHDVMYHSAIASRLASDFPDRSGR